MYIHSLHVFPIKSCKGISLKSVHAGRTGLELDRQWMLVKKRDMSFVTQRTHPRMSQIEVSLCDQELTRSTASPLHSSAADAGDVLRGSHAGSKGTLRVEYLSQPAVGTMTLPVHPPIPQPDQPADATAPEGSGIVQAKVWEWLGDVWDEGDAAAEWFSTVLDDQVRLVRYIGGALPAAAGASAAREVSAEFAPGHETAFADGFPILLATEVYAIEYVAKTATVPTTVRLHVSDASLGGWLQLVGPCGAVQASRQCMEEEAGIPIEMERFRPNVVVAGSGMPPFAEDGWSTVTTGRDADGNSLTCRLVKPCTRCTIPDINPATGVTEGREIFQALSRLRTGKVLRQEKLVYDRREWTNRTFFGWNVVVDSTGLLSVGDLVEVEEERAP